MKEEPESSSKWSAEASSTSGEPIAITAMQLVRMRDKMIDAQRRQYLASALPWACLGLYKGSSA